MATYTPKALQPGIQLTGSAAALYTVPAATRAQITTATFTNTHTANNPITVHIVRSGDSAAADNILIDPQSTILPPGKDYISPDLYGQVLNAGDAIWGLAGTTATVNVIINGFEIAG